MPFSVCPKKTAKQVTEYRITSWGHSYDITQIYWLNHGSTIGSTDDTVPSSVDKLDNYLIGGYTIQLDKTSFLHAWCWRSSP